MVKWSREKLYKNDFTQLLFWSRLHTPSTIESHTLYHAIRMLQMSIGFHTNYGMLQKKVVHHHHSFTCNCFFPEKNKRNQKSQQLARKNAKLFCDQRMVLETFNNEWIGYDAVTAPTTCIRTRPHENVIRWSNDWLVAVFDIFLSFVSFFCLL